MLQRMGLFSCTKDRIRSKFIGHSVAALLRFVLWVCLWCLHPDIKRRFQTAYFTRRDSVTMTKRLLCVCLLLQLVCVNPH